MKYNFFKIVGLVLCLNLYQYSYAQNEETENEKNLPNKVTHAEPLYIDLIRDLGARKGEREWNVGLGLTDRSDYDEYITLVEYEWAPIEEGT